MCFQYLSYIPKSLVTEISSQNGVLRGHFLQRELHCDINASSRESWAEYGSYYVQAKILLPL